MLLRHRPRPTGCAGGTRSPSALGASQQQAGEQSHAGHGAAQGLSKQGGSAAPVPQDGPLAPAGTRAPSLTAAQPLHGLCVPAAAPSASAPLGSCQPHCARAPGRLSSGIQHFGWIRTSPQAPHQLVAGRGRAGLELSCPDGFACKELLGQGEWGGAVLLTPVCGASGRQRFPARESRVRPQGAETTAAETRSLLCSRCRGDGGASGRGGGAPLAAPPRRGARWGAELSAPASFRAS